MGDVETTERTAKDRPAPGLEREVAYLRRDVERLSLRLRQETERTEALERELSAERSEREGERGRLVAEAERRRSETAALEERLGELDDERAWRVQLERELGALRTELRWARVVSASALFIVFALAVWLLVLAL